MTRITNSDQVLLLLQARLQSKKAGSKKTDSSARPQKTQGRKDAISRVRNIAQDPALSDDAIHKALIRGLLTQEFGPQIANDAGFQKVIDDVVGVLKADEAGADLLKAAAGQLLE